MKVKLGDIVNFQNGYAFKSNEYQKTGHYLIRIKNVQQGFIAINDECYVHVPDDEKYKKFVLKSGDIVISLTGNVGRIAVIDKSHLPAVLNQRVASVSPNDLNLISSSYLYYLLRSSSFFNFAVEAGKGAAQQNISTSDLENYTFDLPSLPVQGEIVEKISSAFAFFDEQSKILLKKIEKIDSLFSQLCQAEILKLDADNFTSVKDLAELVTKGTTPTSLGYKFSKSGINFLKVESLSEQGEFLKDKFAFIDNKCHHALKRSQLKTNDILVSIAGALGRTAIVSSDICPANVNQALAIIRLSTESPVSAQYLFSLLQAGYFNEDFKRLGAGAAQQNLSLAQIGSLQVPIFDLSKQQDFIEFLSKTRTLVEEYKTIVSRKKHLHDELKMSFLEKTLFNELVEVA